MPTLTSELIARLKDGISGPAKTAGRSLDGLVAKANRTGGKGGLLGNLNKRTTEASKDLLAFGGVVGGVALAAKSYTNFADFDRHMTRIGITAEATAGEVAKAKVQVRDIANATGLGVADVTNGLDSLTASGRDMKTAMAFLPAIAKTAQASGADVVDMAASADALGANLKVSAGDMQTAFDILAKAGKEGKFELKDMAQFLPSLAAAGNAVGLSGLDGTRKMAAMLQVVRTQTGDSSSAATNLLNVFQKMTSQETVNKFKKMGVMDLRGDLEKAKKSGKDVLDTFLDLSEKATKGDLSKIPQLFNDAQMQAGMRALLGRRDLLRSMYGDLANAGGTVGRDFDKVTNDAASGITRLRNAADAAFNSIGESMDKLGASNQITLFAKDINEAVASISSLTKNISEKGVIDGIAQTIADDQERARNTPAHGGLTGKTAWEMENERVKDVIAKGGTGTAYERSQYLQGEVGSRQAVVNYADQETAGGQALPPDMQAEVDRNRKELAPLQAELAGLKATMAKQVADAKASLAARSDQEFAADHPDFKMPARPSGRQVLGPPMPARAPAAAAPVPAPPEIRPQVNTDQIDQAHVKAVDLKTALEVISLVNPTVNVTPGNGLDQTISKLQAIKSLTDYINSNPVSAPSGGPARGGSRGSYSDTGIK